MNTVQVKIADLAVLRERGMLVTYGLGSCIGAALYDPKRKVAGLVHILLNDSLWRRWPRKFCATPRGRLFRNSRSGALSCRKKWISNSSKCCFVKSAG